MLKSVASRRAFLTDTGGLLRRGNCRSVADLRVQVLHFAEYHNRLRAEPYQ